MSGSPKPKTNDHSNTHQEPIRFTEHANPARHTGCATQERNRNKRKTKIFLSLAA
jgi:hypothetical protein